MATGTTTWVAGTAALSAALLAGSWFGLVEPQLAAAAETRSHVAELERENADQRAALVALEEQFAHIDDLRGDLSRLRDVVPTTTDVPGYLREVDGLAHRTGVAVTDLTPAQPLVPVPAPEAPAYPAGMVAVPVTLGVTGGYDAVLDFVRRLQAEGPRLTLVSSLDASPVAVGDAGTVGGLQVTLRAAVFALPSDVDGGASDGSSGSTASTEPGGASAGGEGDGQQPTLPTPAPGTNPFTTVG